MLGRSAHRSPRRVHLRHPIQRITSFLRPKRRRATSVPRHYCRSPGRHRYRSASTCPTVSAHSESPSWYQILSIACPRSLRTTASAIPATAGDTERAQPAVPRRNVLGSVYHRGRDPRTFRRGTAGCARSVSPAVPRRNVLGSLPRWYTEPRSAPALLSLRQTCEPRTDRKTTYERAPCMPLLSLAHLHRRHRILRNHPPAACP